MRRSLYYTLLVYILAVVVVFPYVRWYADNPDSFQYLEIARKYLSGNFSGAINGYWSPLISWLLSLLLIFTSDGLLAFKILQLIIGVFVIYQWNNLIHATDIRENWLMTLSLVIIPFIIDYALLNLTPDLLFMGLIFLFLRILIKGKALSSRKMALMAGLTGGFLFLTKAFGFPFFIAVIIMVIIAEIYSGISIRLYWKNIISIFLVFFVITFSWIAVISNKYDHFTISEAIRFNTSRDVVPLPGRTAGLPILSEGLAIPQDNNRSAWETPGDYVSQERVNLFTNVEEYISVIKRNVLSIYYFDFRRQVGMFFLIFLALFIFLKGVTSLRKKWIVLSLMFIFLIYSGYSLILIHTRYIWTGSLLMLLLGIYFISEILHAHKWRTFAYFLSALLIIVGCKRPVKEILFTTDKDYPVYWLFQSFKHPLQTMAIFYRPDSELHETIQDLRNKKVIDGNIASLPMRVSDRDPYTSSMRIALENDCRYFGQLVEKSDLTSQISELKAMKIDYVIAYNDEDWVSREPVYENLISKIRVYKVSP